MIQKNNKLNGTVLVWAAAIAVLLITFGAFSGVLQSGFLMWDDDITILNNQNLKEDSIWWVFTDVDTTQRYNPLIFLVWSLVYRLAGFNPFWFHCVSVLCHSLSAALLYLSLREMLEILESKGRLRGTSQFWREVASVTGSLLWALHPLRVEVVALAATATYCQATLFLMGSLLCYLKTYRAQSPVRRRVFAGVTLFCYACSLLTFPIGITFFFVFFLMDIYVLQRVDFADTDRRWTELKSLLLEKMLFALPALIFAMAAVAIRHRPNAIWAPPVSLSDFSIVDRAMQAFYILGYYIWKPLYPFNLAPIYTTLISFDPLATRFIISLLTVAVITLACFSARKRWPVLLALWLCYFVLQVPFLGIFEHPYFTVDRYSMLSSLVLSLAAALAISIISVTRWIHIVTVCTVVLLTTLGTLSWRQVMVWESSETLFTHIIKNLGNDPFRIQIMGRLAIYYEMIGDTEKSIATLKNILDLKPSSFRAHSKLAYLYNSTGRFSEALPHYLNMISLRPDDAAVHFNLGVVLKNLNRNEESEQEFRRAELLQVRPVTGPEKERVRPEIGRESDE